MMLLAHIWGFLYTSPKLGLTGEHFKLNSVEAVGFSVFHKIDSKLPPQSSGRFTGSTNIPAD